LALPFEQLDFVYMPTRDPSADMEYFTAVLGGRLIFAVEGMGAKVAMIQLTDEPPRILLADHLEGERPVLVYRVENLSQTLKDLAARGWEHERTFEIPQGPICSFIAPGGQRLAVYQLTRPQVEEHFTGRRDF
jgi:hypothetical protein